MDWISVKDRMPELDEMVLVIVSGQPLENVFLEDAVELACLYEDGWCLESWPEYMGARVSHWMPIPELPGWK